MNVVDQTNDPGFGTLQAVAKRFPELTEMSKTAELDSSEFEELPSAAFAWETRRQFPIHNKEHTAISLGYRKLASAVPAEVDEKLRKAAVAYDIDLTMFDEPVAVKTASEEFFLLESGRFRVASSEDVTYAEDALLRKYASLSPQDRAEAFVNLGKVAQHYGVSLKPSTEKLAGFTMTSTRLLRDWVEARKEAASILESSVKTAYEKLAHELGGPDRLISDRGDQVKLASLVSELDEKSGVNQFYGESIPDPIQTVYNTTKKASDMVQIGSLMIDKAKLAALPMSFWESLLGDDVAKEIATNGDPDIDKLAPMLPTLPADLAIVAQKQLAHLA
jgi:hypothetical protein